MARWLEAVQAVGMAMVHRSLPIPFAQARICIDSATVTRQATRMMAQAVAAREQCHKHRNGALDGISKAVGACNSEYASSEGQGDAAAYQAR